MDSVATNKRQPEKILLQLLEVQPILLYLRPILIRTVKSNTRRRGGSIVAYQHAGDDVSLEIFVAVSENEWERERIKGNGRGYKTKSQHHK